MLQVPLGVFPKCENKSDEMLDILLHFSKYIPQKEAEEHCLIASTGEEVPITTIKYHQVLFGGDQLTCQRARGVQRAMQNADKPSLKCEGFVPVNEDWHSKLCLMGVSIVGVANLKYTKLEHGFCVVYMPNPQALC